MLPACFPLQPHCRKEKPIPYGAESLCLAGVGTTGAGSKPSSSKRHQQNQQAFKAWFSVSHGSRHGIIQHTSLCAGMMCKSFMFLLEEASDVSFLNTIFKNHLVQKLCMQLILTQGSFRFGCLHRSSVQSGGDYLCLQITLYINSVVQILEKRKHVGGVVLCISLSQHVQCCTIGLRREKKTSKR